MCFMCIHIPKGRSCKVSLQYSNAMIVGHTKAQEQLLILFLPFLPWIGMNVWICAGNNMKSDIRDQVCASVVCYTRAAVPELHHSLYIFHEWHDLELCSSQECFSMAPLPSQRPLLKWNRSHKLYLPIAVLQMLTLYLLC